jgi:hypothetical protein
MKSFIRSEVLLYLLLFPIGAVCAFFYTKNVGPIKQYNLGLDFEYVPVDEGSSFICRAEPIGKNSQPWILSLQQKQKTVIDTNEHYICIGYMRKRIRLKANLCTN